MKEFTNEEIRKFDGRDGRPAYVVVNGKVYDVSSSGFWIDGNHMQQHNAGNDLTESLTKAPHDDEVFQKVPQVGILKSDDGKREPVSAVPAWALWILGFHPHPIAVHFPQGLLTFAPLFLLLFYFTGNQHFERTAFYLLVCGTFMMIPAIISGFFHWIYKFARISGGVYFFKIIMSFVALIVACLAIAIHLKSGILPQNPIAVLLLILYLLMIPILISIGHAGGTIVFGPRK